MLEQNHRHAHPVGVRTMEIPKSSGTTPAHQPGASMVLLSVLATAVQHDVRGAWRVVPGGACCRSAVCSPRASPDGAATWTDSPGDTDRHGRARMASRGTDGWLSEEQSPGFTPSRVLITFDWEGFYE